jgi:hypothetical protein
MLVTQSARWRALAWSGIMVESAITDIGCRVRLPEPTEV